MRSLNYKIVAVIVCLCSLQAFAFDITTDAAFDDLWGLEDEYTFTEVLSPYIFGVGGVATSFSINADRTLIVEPGASIEFEEDCQLIVDGIFIVGDEEDDDVTEINGLAGDRWDAIIIRGNGVAGNGVANFYYTEITEGGMAGGSGGLIVLTNFDNTLTYPDLLLHESSLSDSETDGIFVVDANLLDDDQVESTIEVLANSVISGDLVDVIEGHGIHYENSVDEEVTTYLKIDNSEITDIDHCGVYHEECRALGGTGVGLTLIIQNGSDISDNGEDGVEILCPFIPFAQFNVDFTTAEIILDNSTFLRNGDDLNDVLDGWGFKLRELPDVDPVISTVNVTDCEFNFNDEGGLCFYNVTAQPIFIDECTASSNGVDIEEEGGVHPNVYQHGQGMLLYGRTANCGNWQVITVMRSTISNNYLTGLHLRHWREHGIAVHFFVQGNTISDNGQNVDYLIPDANDLMEGANIHAYTNVDNLRITNNIIEGAYCGIYLEHVGDLVEIPDHMPRGISIYNNIQYGEAIGLDWTQHGLFIESMDDDGRDGDPPIEVFLDEDAIYNNVFYDNEVTGIRLGLGVGTPFSDLEADELCNNVIGSTIAVNNLLGIDLFLNRALDDGPAYANNAFWNCDNANVDGFNPVSVIASDPLFVDADNQDFHLRWDSPLINRGTILDDQFNRATADPDMTIGLHGDNIDRDGSLNDRGVYGGYFANGTIDRIQIDFGDLMNDADSDYPEEADENTFGWDPYCKIDTDFNEVTNDNLPDNADDGDRDYLEWDYYRAFDSFECPSGEELDISDDAEVAGKPFFEFVDDEAGLHKFDIEGVVHANHDAVGVGEENDPDWITFAGYEEDEWDRIYVHTDDAASTTFEATRVMDADYGFYIWGVDSEDDAVILTDCYIHDCRRMGIQIGDSEVTVRGTDNEPAVAADVWTPDHLVNSVQNILDDPGDGYDVRGIYATLCPNVGDVEIKNTNTFKCGEDDEDNYIESGILLFGTPATLTDVSCLRNGTVGLAVVASDPDMDGTEESWANDFAYNGEDFAEQGSDGHPIDGAEVYLTAGSYPNIQWNDFMELDDDGDPLGYLLVKNPVNNANDLDDAEHCFWAGVNVGIANESDVFYWDDADPPGACDIDYGVEEENEIDDNETFEYAKELYHSGSYEAAITVLQRIIAARPGSVDGSRSVRFLLSCFDKMGEGYDDLRDYLDTLTVRCEVADFVGLVQTIRPYCSLNEGDYAAALEEFEEVADNENISYHATIARIAAMELSLNIDYDRIDAVEHTRMRHSIDHHLKSLGNVTQQNDAIATPVDFGLVSAFPNPFNATTRINYSVPLGSDLTIRIFDLAGRSVANLAIPSQRNNVGSVTWNALGVPSGTYLCRLESGNRITTTKLVIVK